MTGYHSRILLLSAVLISLLPGCSRIQLVYNQMDWVIPVYLESYMELSDAQSSYLKEHVKSFLSWHCSTQLAGYSKLIRDAASSVQTGSIERSQIESYNQRIEQFWYSIMRQASPVISTVLADASNTQVEELFSDFEEENREWLEEYQEQTAEELRMNNYERMTTELERWFGPLNPIQQQAVTQWSYKFSPLGMEGLETRVNWQLRLRALLDQRKDREFFKAAFQELVVAPDNLRSPAYQRKLDNNREVTIDLLYFVMNNTSETQRRKQSKKAESVARDIDKLVCSTGTGNTSP